MSPSSQPSGTPIRVLLVEDAMDHAHLLMALLKQEGDYRITHSQDGDRAIELVDGEEFDLVITDLNLPGTDGFDVIRHVKKARPDLPVLATTGYSTPGWFDQAYRAGADDLIPKPLDRETLLQKVGDVLRSGGRFPNRSPSVLAITAREGDVEKGCGGTLARHAREGDDVLILSLAPPSEEGDDGFRHAAEILGARIIMARAAVGSSADEVQLANLVERIVKELKPHTVYVPSGQDRDEQRSQAHRIARGAIDEVPNIFAYPTDTCSDDFNADHTVDVSDEILIKLEALAAYHGTGKVKLTATLSEEEGLEVVRSEEES